MLLNVLLVQWVGRRKLEVPSVNRAKLVHLVTSWGKGVKIVSKVNIVQAVWVLLAAEIVLRAFIKKN